MKATTQTPLWWLFKSPVLRETFRIAGRDNGMDYAVPAPRRPDLDHGAAERVFVRAFETAQEAQR